MTRRPLAHPSRAWSRRPGLTAARPQTLQPCSQVQQDEQKELGAGPGFSMINDASRGHFLQFKWGPAVEDNEARPALEREWHGACRC